MNGVDYTKQLARDREYFRDTVKKNNEANDKRLEDANIRNETVQKKQSETFIEDKADLEKKYQETRSNMEEKTRNALQNNQDDYNKRLAETRDNFVKESESKRREFDQRMNDIKSGFRRAQASERETHEEVQNVQKNRYNQNLVDIKKDSADKLQTYQDKMLGAGADLKAQYNQERSQLVRAQEDNLKAQQRDAADKRNALQERIGREIATTKEVAENEKDQARRYAQDQMSNVQKRFQERSETMAKDYSDRSALSTQKLKQENLNNNKAGQEKLMALQKDINRQNLERELDEIRQDDGSGEFGKVMAAQKGINEKIQHENQMRSMLTKLTDSQRNYQARAAREQESFNETLRTEKKESLARTDKKISQINADRIATIDHEKKKSTRQLDNLNLINAQTRTEHEQQSILERKNSKDRMEKLKEDFNKSMLAIQEKNKIALEDVTKIAKEDKAEFVKRMNEARNQEIFGMRREFSKMMDATVEEYEKRLAIYQKDNESLKMLMDQKVTTITDEAEKNIANQKKLFDERRSSDQKAQALVNDQKEFQYRTTMAQTNITFQKKLDKLQHANDTKLKLLTNDYENKLKELRAQNSKMEVDKDAQQMAAQERLKQSYEAEKLRIIGGYENQITEMKKSHQQQLEALKDYKRLS